MENTKTTKVMVTEKISCGSSSRPRPVLRSEAACLIQLRPRQFRGRSPLWFLVELRQRVRRNALPAGLLPAS